MPSINALVTYIYINTCHRIMRVSHIQARNTYSHSYTFRIDMLVSILSEISVSQTQKAHIHTLDLRPSTCNIYIHVSHTNAHVQKITSHLHAHMSLTQFAGQIHVHMLQCSHEQCTFWWHIIRPAIAMANVERLFSVRQKNTNTTSVFCVLLTVISYYIL